MVKLQDYSGKYSSFDLVVYMEIFMDLPMTWQACKVISSFDPCSLLHGNFHGFTIDMEKFQEYK